MSTPPDEPGTRPPPAERGEWEQVQFRKPEEIDRPADPANIVGKVLIAIGAVIIFGPILLMGTCAVIVAIVDR